nr:MAG TPA: hypothetical protein [Caudoviricetes sp.]
MTPGAGKISNASRSRGTAWGLACKKGEIKRVIKEEHETCLRNRIT